MGLVLRNLRPPSLVVYNARRRTRQAPREGMRGTSCSARALHPSFVPAHTHDHKRLYTLSPSPSPYQNSSLFPVSPPPFLLFVFGWDLRLAALDVERTMALRLSFQGERIPNRMVTRLTLSLRRAYIFVYVVKCCSNCLLEISANVLKDSAFHFSCCPSGRVEIVLDLYSAKGAFFVEESTTFVSEDKGRMIRGAF